MNRLLVILLLSKICGGYVIIVIEVHSIVEHNLFQLRLLFLVIRDQFLKSLKLCLKIMWLLRLVSHATGLAWAVDDCLRGRFHKSLIVIAPLYK